MRIYRRYDKGIFEDGREEGREEKQIEIAGKLKGKGMDIHSISEITGLTVSRIRMIPE